MIYAIATDLETRKVTMELRLLIWPMHEHLTPAAQWRWKLEHLLFDYE